MSTMISLGGLVLLCAAMASGSFMVKKDFLKTMMSCGTMSRFKTTLLENPSEIPTRCVYTFSRHSPDVTQIRIEMEELQLMQPQEVMGSPDQKKCVNRLAINDISLCGRNNGQHLYIPFDAPYVNVVFEVPISDPQTRWKLNVTQLTSASAAIASVSANQLQLPLVNGIRHLKNKIFSEQEDDAFSLAPPGCTQYFTAHTGVVESFNYNGGAGPYMSNMSYTICFKRFIGSTSVKLTFDDFGLPNEGNHFGMDLDCHSAVPTLGKQEDYLVIPGASLQINEADVNPTYFCGTSTTGKTITFGNLGPYVMYFYSDLLSSNDDKGFRIQYRIV